MSLDTKKPHSSKSTGGTKTKSVHHTISWILVSTLLFFISAGVNIVMFPVILMRNNVSETLMGVSATTEVIAGMLIAPFVPRIVRKLGITTTLSLFMILYIVAILLLPLYHSFVVWMMLMFVFGMGWFVYMSLRQAWINMMISNKNRAKTFAIQAMAIASGLVIGPAVVKAAGTENYNLFLIQAVFVSISALILYSLKSAEPKVDNNPKFDLKKYAFDRPMLFLAKFIEDFSFMSIFVFTVVFGVNSGFSATDSGFLLSAFSISTAIDILIGHISDKSNSKHKVIGAGMLGCFSVMVALLVFSGNYYAFLPLYFVLGVSMAAIYLTAPSILNSSYKKEDLVSANATYGFVGNVGGICGSMATATAIDFFGANGFPIPMMSMCALYLICSLFWKK